MEQISAAVHDIQHPGERSSSGASSWDTEYSSVSHGEPSNNRELILQANHVPLAQILLHYGHQVDDYNRQIRCPFHKNGQERSPSFVWYPDNNSFHCFGCKAGTRSVDFVARAEKLAREDAALFILEHWADHLLDSFQPSENKNFSENILFEFADMIRDFVEQQHHSIEAVEYADKLCYSFDELLIRLHKNPERIGVSLLEKIKLRLEKF